MHDIATTSTILDQGQFEFYTVSEHGIEFKPDTPREEWLKAVEQLTTMHESSGRLHFRAICILSDALNFGEKAYGEEYSEAIDASRAWMRVSTKTIQNAMWVMSKIPPSRRRELLTLAHHDAVASLEPEEQDEFLTKAEEGSLTVAELRKLVKAAHPKTARGKDRKHKDESKASFKIENATDAKKAATALSNWMTANEDKVNDTWKPLLEHFYKLFRRRWMSGHAKR
jgi:hypothetical protein